MNLFLPVYKRLEEEVLKLSDTIFFDDDQLRVYSLTIGDLIIRCAVEVEAVSKELYLRLGGVEKPLDKNGDERDLYYDTDCIKLLVETWAVNKKKLQISNPNMYFTPAKSIITPLHKAHKRGTSSSKWQQAYQAVKHYRTRSIKKATIANLLNALGALYILNLYYSDESFWSETPIKDRREYAVDSKIFTPFVFDASHISMCSEMSDASIKNDTDPTLVESIFIKKVREEAFREIHGAYCKFDLRIILKLKTTEQFKKYLKDHPEAENMPAVEVAALLGLNYISLIANEAKALGSPIRRLSEKEVVLNKNEKIYPNLTLQDYMNSDVGRKYLVETANSIIQK